jgi:hypothetical protein
MDRRPCEPALSGEVSGAGREAIILFHGELLLVGA